MSDPLQWPDPDADKFCEMEAARGAYTRLFEALRQLEADIGNLPARSERLQRFASKRLGALHGLQRHAQWTIDRFAFVDGELVERPHPELLTAFYTDPNHCVAARYCCALLGADEDRASLQNILRATGSEFESFLAQDAGEQQTARGEDVRAALLAAEHGHARRTDRLAYRLSILNRLMILQRHISGSSEATRALEAEIAKAEVVADEANDVLRKIRRAKLSKRK